MATYSIKESEKESRTSNDTGSDGVVSQTYSIPQGKAPAFGDDNSLLAPIGGKESLKRRKPKTSLVKSNSSYISRVIPHESMSKRVQDHNPEGLYVFANIDRAFQWLDFSSTTFSKVGLTLPVRLYKANLDQAEHIVKILFAKAHVLCHDINLFTKSPNHLDVIMGTSSADIMWFEALTQKYNRINKNVGGSVQQFRT